MRQRLHIARGLLRDPEVVSLDEPTIDVDPVGARELRATIASLTAAGKTVLLTTRYMFEADVLYDRIAVITRPRIVAKGTLAALKAGVGEGSVRRGRGLRDRWSDTRVVARADARGRLRCARRRVKTARLLSMGWLFQMTILMRSASNSWLGVLYALFFAKRRVLHVPLGWEAARWLGSADMPQSSRPTAST